MSIMEIHDFLVRVTVKLLVLTPSTWPKTCFSTLLLLRNSRYKIENTKVCFCKSIFVKVNHNIYKHVYFYFIQWMIVSTINITRFIFIWSTPNSKMQIDNVVPIKSRFSNLLWVTTSFSIHFCTSPS